MYHVPIMLVAHARCAGEQGFVRPQLLYVGVDSCRFITAGLMLLSKKATLSAIRKPGEMAVGAKEHFRFVPEHGEPSFLNALSQVGVDVRGIPPCLDGAELDPMQCLGGRVRNHFSSRNKFQGEWKQAKSTYPSWTLARGLQLLLLEWRRQDS